MDAIAALTGVSLGAVHTIPTILLPELGPDEWSLGRLAEPVARTASIPDQPSTIRLDGRGWNDQPMSIFISKETGLVVRIEDHHPSGAPRSVTEYAPAANLEVAPEELSPGMELPL
jgi:hypothetical protein